MAPNVAVDCSRGSKLIASYDFLVPASLASPPIPYEAALKEEAKTNLSKDNVGAPPFDDFTF